MSVSSGFFNAINGDRLYTAEQMSEYFLGIIGDGVCENVGGRLAVSAGSGMSVRVASGRAFIGSKWLDNSASYNLNITAADASNNRYTAVIVRLDRANRTMTLTTKDGTPAASPTKPQMTVTSTGISEICLAYVYVPMGSTSIAASNIEDTRANSNICGWVTGVIEQVDTSDLFTQWQAAYQAYYNQMQAEFETWFNALTQKLGVITYIDKSEATYTKPSAGRYVDFPDAVQSYVEGDTLIVFVNGLYRTDYTIQENEVEHIPMLQFTSNLNANDVVSFLLMKSKIGIQSV